MTLRIHFCSSPALTNPPTPTAIRDIFRINELALASRVGKSVVIVSLLLAACAPVVATPLLTATEAATNTSQTSLPPPTQAPAGGSETALPETTPAADRELTFKVVEQLGGSFEAVAVDGNIVYLGIGPHLATVDIRDPSSPQLLWQSEVLPGVPEAIAVQPGRAYLRIGTDLLIYDVSDPALPVQVGSLSGVAGDLLAGRDQVYTFDPGDPDHPVIVVDASDPAHPTLAGTREHSGNAAIAVSGEVFYLASGGEAPDGSSFPGTLDLLDRNNIERSLSSFALDPASSYQVAVAGDIAFVVENNRVPGNPDVLLALDASDPAHPREITRQQMSLGQDIRATGEALFHLRRSFPHSGCPTGLSVLDITNPASPQGPFEFDPQSCFNRYAVTGDTLAATSERGLQIFNLSGPANIALAGEWTPPDGFITVERVALDRGLAYLLTTAGRNRQQRLRVLDLAGSTPTLLNGDGLDLSDPEPSIFNGLHARGERLFGLGPTPVDISDPARPRMAVGDIGAGDTEGVFYWPPPVLVENVLYTGLLTNTPDGLRISGGLGIVDVSDPDRPALVNRVPMEGFTVSAMTVVDRRLIVYSDPRLRIYDVSDPFNPIEVGGLDLPLIDPTLDIIGDTVYLATPYDDPPILYAVDITDPAHPAEIGKLELSDPDIVTKMIAAGDTIYMRLQKGGILAVNVSDRSNPVLSGRFPLPISDFTVDSDLLYLAASDAGFYIVQVEE